MKSLIAALVLGFLMIVGVANAAPPYSGHVRPDAHAYKQPYYHHHYRPYTVYPRPYPRPYQYRAYPNYPPYPGYYPYYPYPGYYRFGIGISISR